MNPRESLLKEIFDKVGDKISEQTIAEKINQFLRHGNMFLLFEVMSLRKEIERMKEQIRLQSKNRTREPVNTLPL